MKTIWARTALAVALVVGVSLAANAADSIWGRVTAVKSPDVIVLNYGTGEYVIRIVGIDAPPASARAARTEAQRVVTQMLLGKNARVRFERRAGGEMVGRVFTDEPDPTRIRDVGVELVRQGLARRRGTYDTKYGDMAAAEKEARSARRGLWAPAQQPR
jgi:endonuclease YncB( thermonuclease family)